MKRTPGFPAPAALGLGLVASLGLGCHKFPFFQSTAPAAAVAVAAPAARPAIVPTPTPVNDTVAFVREGALWLEHSTGAGPRLLALPDGNEDFWFPAVAPDGSSIVAWLSRGDGTQDLVRVDPDGKVTALTDTGDQASPLMKDLVLHNAPAFSPDGARIAYSFNGDIWVMDADGLNAQTLINDGASWAPAWSPDGKQIAYVSGGEGHRDLWITNVDNRDSVQATAFENYTVGSPRWSPDGQRLLMTRSHGEDSDIVAVAAKSDSPTADADVFTHDHLSVSAAYDPLGSGGIVFSSAHMDGGDWNLYVENASGSMINAITQDGGMSPDWSKLPFGSAAAAPHPSPTAVPLPKPVPTPRPAAAVHPAAPAPLTRTSAVPAKPAVPAKKHHHHAASSVSGTATALSATAAAPAKTPAVRTAAAAPKPIAAAALPPTVRLRLAASFDDQDRPDADTEAGIKALVPRVKPYAAYTLDVIGPLDGSDLKGLYFSADSRSQTRAQEIGADLAKLAGFPASAVKAEPYSPPAGGGGQKSVLIYVELR